MALVLSIIFGAAVFMMTYSYNVRLLDWLRFQSLGTRDYIVEKLNGMFIEATPDKVLLYMMGAAFVPFVLTFVLFLPNLTAGLIFGVLFAIAGWKLPKPIVDYMMKRRINKFNLQMVDGLNLMANAMKSGLSVNQAMSIVVDQMPNPIAQEFNLVLSETKLGLSLEESLQNLGKRVPCEDVDMFVTSVVILKETGGNLAETFDTIVGVIRDRIKVQSKIEALTAMGMNQGMVLLAVPPLMGIYFSFSEPELMKPMFENPIGWGAILLIIGLEVTAFFVIRKIMTIDV